MEISSMGYVYDRMRDYSLALQNQKKALKIALEYCDDHSIGLIYLNDSIMNTEKTNQVAQMRVRFETNQKEKEFPKIYMMGLVSSYPG